MWVRMWRWVVYRSQHRDGGAIHAVVAAGGQYVPIATDAPADRVQYMLETAGVGIVLTDARIWIPEELSSATKEPTDGVSKGPVRRLPGASTSGRSGWIAPVRWICRRLRSLMLSGWRRCHSTMRCTVVHFGSDGSSEGVTVSHRAVLNRLWWGLDAFGWALGDRVVQKTPYTFDVSVPELFAPLFTGAQVVIARPGGHADPGTLPI